MEVRELLEQVKSGKVSVDEAEKYFKRQPFEELGYAKLDSHREIRSGKTSNLLHIIDASFLMHATFLYKSGFVESN